ncbi:hypothetical protein C2S53_002854 [Perilla frutescens var. hirtella]|uniref:Zinc knuckle CX2CX4HX4C domain-containing protein n=1 Tax=Perilla frutescens var. hirtella TaxID=608512 RepID=A0AAD4IZN6_PERFH|nr:hypothetical protein C2S53_002854 [Perilla frutescens var. hirtella]
MASMERLTADEKGEIDLNSLVGEDLGMETNTTICMVGRLVTDKPPNTYYLLDVLKKSWKVKKIFSAQEWGHNLFLFWVWFEGRDRLDRLESFVEMDDNIDGYVGNYLRIKVLIDVTKPILRGLTIKLNGKKLWIPIKIESLPVFCSGCGIIGHHVKQCPSGDKKNYSNMKDIPCGPWLRASPLKILRLDWDSRGFPENLSPKKLFQQKSLEVYTPLPSHVPLPLYPTANPDIPPSSLKIIPSTPTHPSTPHVELLTIDQPLSSAPTAPSGSNVLSFTQMDPSESISPKFKSSNTISPTAQRPGDNGILDNEFELLSVFKKLKETELVDVPCIFAEIAEIA